MKKTVLITGSSSGIGKGCCELFEKSGWVVIGLDINGEQKVDVSSSESLHDFFEGFKEKGLALNAVINNAAIQVEKKLVETTEEEWDRVLDTNLKSIFLLTKEVLPYFASKASIINISSVHAKATSMGLASYVASKGGVSSLTRAMALELADLNIRVNAILPGAIDTQMLRQGLSRNDSFEVSKEKLINGTPLKRIGSADDVAQLALFLADPQLSKNITGQEFICDGGVTSKLASE